MYTVNDSYQVSREIAGFIYVTNNYIVYTFMDVQGSSSLLVIA